MKIVMTFVVRDEEDVIAHNLDYHKAMGVDHFIVYDHLSCDETPKILRSYEEKKWLSYYRINDSAFLQDQWMTELAQLAFEQGATWILPNDADEFWVPESNETLREFFSDKKADVVVVNRSNFIPNLTTDGIFIEKMIYRERNSLNTLGKELPPKVAFRAANGRNVSFGNHSVALTDSDVVTKTDRLKILHYPYRSIPQVQSQIKNGVHSLNQNQMIGPGINNTWRRLHELDDEGNLRRYLEDQSQNIEHKLREGNLIKDERIKNFFKKIK